MLATRHSSLLCFPSFFFTEMVLQKPNGNSRETNLYLSFFLSFFLSLCPVCFMLDFMLSENSWMFSH